MKKQVLLTISDEYRKYIIMKMGAPVYKASLLSRAIELAIKKDMTFEPYIDTGQTGSVSINIEMNIYNRVTKNGKMSGAKSIYKMLNYSRAKRDNTKYSISTDKTIYKMLTDIGQGDPSAGLKLALGITE